MSKTIYDVTLLELLPENLRSDPDIIAASKALDEEYRQLAQSIKNALFAFRSVSVVFAIIITTCTESYSVTSSITPFTGGTITVITRRITIKLVDKAFFSIQKHPLQAYFLPI